jgi:hypothetical protein
LVRIFNEYLSQTGLNEMRDRELKNVLCSLHRPAAAPHNAFKSYSSVESWLEVETAKLNRFHSKIARRRRENLVARREACEVDKGWFTTRTASEQFLELKALPLNRLASMLNRLRRLRQQPIRRILSDDGTLGALTYHRSVVEAVIIEVKMTNDKSKRMESDLGNLAQ